MATTNVFKDCIENDYVISPNTSGAIKTISQDAIVFIAVISLGAGASLNRLEDIDPNSREGNVYYETPNDGAGEPHTNILFGNINQYLDIFADPETIARNNGGRVDGGTQIRQDNLCTGGTVTIRVYELITANDL